MIKCLLAEGDGCKNCCYFCNDRSTCADACEESMSDCEYMSKEETDLQVMESAVPEVIKLITDITIMKQKFEEQEKAMKQELLKAMERFGVKSFENDQVKFVYVAPTVRKTFDKKAFEKAHPEINLADYDKESKVSASVRISVK